MHHTLTSEIIDTDNKLIPDGQYAYIYIKGQTCA